MFKFAIFIVYFTKKCKKMQKNEKKCKKIAKKFAYIKKMLYLCTEFEKQPNK